MDIMKKIIFLLLMTFGIQTVFAECTSRGMKFFPSKKEISLNSMFIIQGYADSEKTVNSFKHRTVYLESEQGELIELKLQEILKGEMLITQAIFNPVSILKPNTIYFLKYTDQTEDEVKEKMRYNGKRDDRVFWKTTDKISVDELNPNLALEFERTEVEHYGCGPEANAIFKIKNKPEAEVWYKTEVIEMKTHKKVVYYIKESNGTLNVGHGMCSGAFEFKRKGKYKVRFTAMNIDGKSLKKTDWRTFDSPFMNDKNPF